jgi:hypothetical protein
MSGETVTDLEQLLGYDALADAERRTGKDYKTDPETLEFGLALAIMGNKAKADALKAAGDTHYGVGFQQTVEIYEDLGFQAVHRRHFQSRPRDGERVTEQYLLLWHPDGILATLESYQGRSVNNSKIMYNIEFHQDTDTWRIVSSGSFHGPSYDAGNRVWVGDHDAREGLRHTVAKLRTAGTFLPQWKKRPFLWFLEYTQSDSTSAPYKAHAEQVISELPEHVRRAITPQESK